MRSISCCWFLVIAAVANNDEEGVSLLQAARLHRFASNASHRVAGGVRCVSSDCSAIQNTCLNAPKLLMTESSMKENNLGGKGKGKRSREYMRFETTLEVEGDYADLILRASPNYDTREYVNGVDGSVIKVAMESGLKVELEFSWVKRGTETQIMVPFFAVAVMDIDEKKEGNCRATIRNCGASDAAVASATELLVTKSGGCVSATSCAEGSPNETPRTPEPEGLSDLQMARTIVFPFHRQPTASFEVDIKPCSLKRAVRFAIHPSIACLPADGMYISRADCTATTTSTTTTTTRTTTTAAVWWCVASRIAGVSGPFATVEEARLKLNSLGAGSSGNRKLVCELNRGTVKADPHTVGGRNQGAGAAGGFQKWWKDQSDMNEMNAMCQQNSQCRAGLR